MVGVWLDFDTSIIQPWPSTNKPHLGPMEGAAPGTLADCATLHRPKCRVAGASDFYRHNVARAAAGEKHNFETVRILVNTTRPMKVDTPKDPDAQPQTLQPFPFQHLLPLIPAGGLTPDHWKILSERLRNAIAAKSDGLALTEVEARNFRENCLVIQKAGIGLELRNYSLLEVYSAQQWRAEYQTVEEFAKKWAKLSKGQLMKCVDSAQIALMMADADLGPVAPTGRQVEVLAMVEPDHRVSAWKVVLAAFEKNGNTDSEARHVLRNYCDEHDIMFGRRKPNGSKSSHGSTMLPDSKAAIMDPHQQPENRKDWIDNLSSSEDHTLIGILHIDILQSALMEFDGNSPGKMIGKILREIGSDHYNDKTPEHMEAALSLVFRKDPVIEERLRKMALCLLAEAISQKLEHKIRESQITKAEFLEKICQPVQHHPIALPPIC